jgi:hypothetical protein
VDDLFRIPTHAKEKTVNKITTLLMLSAALMLGAGVGGAAADGGNSAGAKSCQHDGWQSLLRTDHTTFANQGACVSYAGQGGELTSPVLSF